MTVRVGVIGVGLIGEDHVRRLTTVLDGASVTAVTDVDSGRAAAVAERYGVATVHATGEEVIADPQVDAVVVASWSPTHEQYVLASIAAGKPVFCEKPLATTAQACWTPVSPPPRRAWRSAKRVGANSPMVFISSSLSAPPPALAM